VAIRSIKARPTATATTVTAVGKIERRLVRAKARLRLHTSSRSRRLLRGLAAVGLVVAVAVPAASAAFGQSSSKPPPVAELSAIPSSGTAPLLVTFDGSMSSDPNGTLSGWTMDFGDGSAAQSGSDSPPSSIQHSYVSAGVFTATLTTNGSGGTSADSTFTVTVGQPAQDLVADLGVSGGSGAAPLSVVFDGATSTESGGSIANWQLTFGDGTTTSGSGPPPAAIAHTFKHKGGYTATLTLVDATGTTATATAGVAVSSTATTAELGTNAGSGDVPLTVTFDGSNSTDPDGTITSWHLLFGDGSAEATGNGMPPAAIDHTYTTAGTFTAHLTVKGSGGFLARATASEIVEPKPPTAAVQVAPESTAQGIHKIQHVIVVMQENRSFDNYFGTFPGADGIPMKQGVPTVCNPDPRAGQCIKPYHDTNVIDNGAGHAASNAIADIDGGQMDGFVGQAEAGIPVTCTPPAPTCPATNPGGSTDVMGYHTAAEIPNYWDYAKHYVLNDHMFEPDLGWSLPSHLDMVSLWSAACSKAGDPESCTSNDEAAGAHTGPVTDYPWTDLTWLLHQDGVSWQYFVGTGGNPDCQDDSANCEASQLGPVLTGPWNPLPDFDDVQQDGQLGNIVATSHFYPEALNGTLPAVSWVVPVGAVSEHPTASISAGMAYVTGLINAVMQGPDWDNTAIFVSWDDWGGFYDNVQPPTVDSVGYGLRVPGLVISPYSDNGKVDHQTLSFDAYAKFIEDDFLDGQTLDPATDGRPDSRPSVREDAPELGDLKSDFDFDKPPSPPYVLNSGPPWGRAPQRGRTPGVTSGTVPLKVAFDGSQSAAGGSPLASWTLSFGDGSNDASGSGPPPASTPHTYVSAGTYRATLSVEDTAGQSASTTATIKVGFPPPVPALVASPPGGIAPVSQVSFDASGTSDPDASISSWRLSFGDGSSPASGSGAPPSPTATHTYTQAGDYEVVLSVTDANGESATEPFTYMVQPALSVNVQSAPPTGSIVVSGSGYEPGETVDIALNGQPAGTATASPTGGFQTSLTVPSAMVAGTYPITATGQASSILGTTTLIVAENWQFRFTAAGGSDNLYETTINPSNVSSLVQAPWEGTAHEAITSSPAVVNGLVYAGSNDGIFREWSDATEAQWRDFVASAPIDSSPVTANNEIFVGTEAGALYGYKDGCGPPTTGSCRRVLTLALDGAIESTPSGAGKELYVGTDSGYEYAINVRAGRVDWKTQLSGPVKSSAAVGSTTVVVGAGNDVYALDTKTGAVKWSAPTGDAVTSSPVIVNAKTVYVGSQDGNLYEYPVKCETPCQPLHTLATGGAVESSPAVANGVLYVGSDSGFLDAFSLKKNALLWQYQTGAAVTSSPAVANGVVYVGSTNDSLYAFDAAGCRHPTCPPVWSAATGGPISSSPAIADGQVFVGSGDGHLYVYQLPQPTAGTAAHAPAGTRASGGACPASSMIGRAAGLSLKPVERTGTDPVSCDYLPVASATNPDATNVELTQSAGMPNQELRALADDSAGMGTTSAVTGVGRSAYLDRGSPGMPSSLFVLRGSVAVKITAELPAASLERIAQVTLSRSTTHH
jgi:phospholipase C/outer membrane protein assembly factor BamB